MRYIVLTILNLIRGIPEKNGEPRADMFLPRWLMMFGVVLGLGAVGFLVAFLFLLYLGLLVGMVICGAISVLALMCWNNQKIVILDEERFEYTTFTGRKKVYRFSDIKALKENNDSSTLFVGDDKIHIESAAIISDRLVEKIVKNLYKN